MPLERFSERLDAQFYKVNGAGLPAPTLAAVGTIATVVASDTVDVALPAGLSDGDYAILLIALSSDSVSSVSVGAFGQVGANQQGVVFAETWGSVVNASDSSATATVQLVGIVATGQAVFLIYRGTNGATPDFSASARGTSVSITQPGVTATGVGLAVALSVSSTVAGSTPPAGWTEGLDGGVGYRLLEDHMDTTGGVIPAGVRTQVSGDWVTFEGVLYP